MTSTLLISYPHIPKATRIITTSGAYAEDLPVQNSILGKRHNVAALETAAASVIIDYDLGSGNTAAVDHVIIAKANHLQGETGITLTLSGNSASRADPDLVTATFDLDIDALTLTGPRGHDYLATVETTTAYRYWWANIAIASGTSKFPISKLYFGQFFDIGTDPASFEYATAQPGENDVEFSTGNVWIGRGTEMRRVYKITWNLVTDANANLFDSTLMRDPGMDMVFLYATNTEILGGEQLVHCQLMAQETRIERGPHPDTCTVVAHFVEEVA
jgi:hypothetical protein